MFSVALCGAVGAYCCWKRLADVFTMVFGCLCWICMLHDVYCVGFGMMGFWFWVCLIAVLGLSLLVACLLLVLVGC